MNIPVSGRTPQQARILGAGHFVPHHKVTTEDIAHLIPGWNAQRIIERTGILERRHLWKIDRETGKPLVPDSNDSDYPRSGTDMCAHALRDALFKADLPATKLDALFLVTCNADKPHFCHDAMELHKRLGLRPDTYSMVIDSGCGGSLYLMDMAIRMIESGAIRSAAIIGSNFSSPLIDRRIYTTFVEDKKNEKSLGAFLSAYVFGDGAGAVILGATPSISQESGVLASLARNEHLDLVLKPGGGSLLTAYSDRITPVDLAFVVNGHLVYHSYFKYMKSSIDEVLAKGSLSKSDIKRFYLHQPNQRLLDAFASSMGIAQEQVASNVARYGNTSSAGMFILLSEDLERGTLRLGSGALVVMAAIGAGVHYGAQLIRL